MLPASHQTFLDRALAVLRDDRRILGVAAAGSYITGELDAFSDLDLVIVVRTDDYDEVMRERDVIAARLGPLLSAFTGEHVGEPRLLICLYDDPLLHVDLKFVHPESLGSGRVDDPVLLWERDEERPLARMIAATPAIYPPVDPQWIEDRIWTWVHYLATKIGRGELFEALDGLTFVRARVLAPLAKTIAGRSPRGVRFLEREIAAELPAFEATHPDRVDRAGLTGATLAVVDLYRRLRRELAAPGLVRRAAAETATMRYLRETCGAFHPDAARD